jgi:ABC-type amino acid transport substrate-binding protein
MKYFSIALVIFFICHASTAQAVDHAYERLLKTGELNCGTYVFNGLFTYAPKTNTPEGFIPDVMNEVAERLNIKIKWTELSSFALAFEELEQGRYDMLCGPFAVDGDLYKKTIYGPALTYDALYVYGDAKKDYSAITSLEQLNSPKYSFVGMDGEFGGRYVPKLFPKAKLVMLPQGAAPGQMMLELETGKVNFIVFTKIAFQAYESANPGKLKQVNTKPLVIMPIRNAFARDGFELRSLYSSVIEDMKHDGTLDRLLKKYHFKE